VQVQLSPNERRLELRFNYRAIPWTLSEGMLGDRSFRRRRIIGIRRVIDGLEMRNGTRRVSGASPGRHKQGERETLKYSMSKKIDSHTVGAEESFGIAVVEKWTRANRRADRRGGRRGSNREHMQICIGYAEEDLMRSFSRLRECERGCA